MTWSDVEVELLNTIRFMTQREQECQAKDVLRLVTAAAIAHDKAKDEQA